MLFSIYDQRKDQHLNTCLSVAICVLLTRLSFVISLHCLFIHYNKHENIALYWIDTLELYQIDYTQKQLPLPLLHWKQEVHVQMKSRYQLWTMTTYIRISVEPLVFKSRFYPIYYMPEATIESPLKNSGWGSDDCQVIFYMSSFVFSLELCVLLHKKKQKINLSYWNNTW